MINQAKFAVTVSEMARMSGLSRARFYQLMGTTFPLPVYHIKTRRPIYVEELQKICLEVRHRNCGIDGKPVLFYSRRAPSTPTSKPRKDKPNSEAPSEIVTGIRALGLTAVTAAQVEASIKKLFPAGVGLLDSGQVIRAVFLHLRQNAADSVGR